MAPNTNTDHLYKGYWLFGLLSIVEVEAYPVFPGPLVGLDHLTSQRANVYVSISICISLVVFAIVVFAIVGSLLLPR